ncbi:prepilin-type N-terminal cleavage/methylation domain-containing protein [Acinetobacter schindleri]|uniref:pilus assembly FimT family protein n=1 Tax=Acinetobacter schindleri TaxID=108981 RepID=UPI00235EE6A7|nr:prepilin-type N-terminal cleavage/methylation domain-containing protein [Acinetobacter schindleri]WDE16297.1 prepilin-type N-terminal cleavage/methylation domain-containing protein [Acinetobacter schindleri]
MQKEKGFTLIELMVTIAVLAIVAGMAAPSFSSMIEQYKLKKNTEELINVLKEARAKSIVDVREVTLNLNSDAMDSGSTINWKATSPVRLKTSANNQIKFNSKGFYVANFSEIELCQKTRPSPSIKIILDKFGKVEKVEAGACSS